MLKLAASGAPPVRLPVGPEAVATMLARSETLRAQAEFWRQLSESTTVDA